MFDVFSYLQSNWDIVASTNHLSPTHWQTLSRMPLHPPELQLNYAQGHGVPDPKAWEVRGGEGGEGGQERAHILWPE
jgi:hypothetical protein